MDQRKTDTLHGDKKSLSDQGKVLKQDIPLGSLDRFFIERRLLILPVSQSLPSESGLPLTD